MASAETRRFDVVVYGGSEGGVMAAVAAAREGASVALVEPGRFVGGMIVAGRSFVLPGERGGVGGLARDFFERVGKYYGEDVAWAFEPHVAGGYFRQMLNEAGVEVFREERLREHNGVGRRKRRIRRIITDNGEVFEAGVFIDASYEGDLMAMGKVSYDVDLPPGPEEEPEVVEREDNHTFVICVSEGADRHPFPKPITYDPAHYAIWISYIATLSEKNGKPPGFGDLVSVHTLPNGKTAATAAAGSTAGNYPESDYRKRVEIWQAHLDYAAGLFYFLANHEGVPEAVRSDFQARGLCADEFVYTNYWPHLIHLRVGRRLRGDFELTQDQVGKGATTGVALGLHGGEPFRIPYAVLLPRKKQAENLLVLVCPSTGPAMARALRNSVASMAVGHAAGIAASLALDEGVAVQDVNTETLTTKLRGQGAVLE